MDSIAVAALKQKHRRSRGRWQYPAAAVTLGLAYTGLPNAFLPAPSVGLALRAQQSPEIAAATQGGSSASSGSTAATSESSRFAVASAASLAAAAAASASRRTRGKKAVRLAADEKAPGGEADDEVKRSSAISKPTAADMRAAVQEAESARSYENLTEEQRGAVSNFFFPDQEDLDMDKSMPLEDHVKELRDGLIRAGAFTVGAVGICLFYYKELTTALEAPAQASGMGVKFVQLAPGEFFFVSVKVAIAIGLLIAFPYALFEASLYFAPALTRSERDVVGPTVLSSAVLFYGGALFAFSVLSPAALGFFLGYSQDVIESQFSIDQYFEFILSMGFATGIAFQVPVLQVLLGLLNVLKSEQLFSVWRYVIVGSAVVGAILTPSTDPVTQLLLSGALCALYFAGAGTLLVLGR
eukprot:TRINITY_DN3643_c5_g1_i1.p1 TRINITY_DN3643_c5_g1~~TRINITY_DN3643_c5_g1_i1.p1  ORF type:complete len:412 (+),score=87.51 TRINITY_DN3643_c5_g1_i1:86-1321(+)